MTSITGSAAGYPVDEVRNVLPKENGRIENLVHRAQAINERLELMRTSLFRSASKTLGGFPLSASNVKEMPEPTCSLERLAQQLEHIDQQLNLLGDIATAFETL